MSLRRDFLEHKNKTIESFNLVSADHSNIQVNMVNLRTMLAASESRFYELTNKISDLTAALERCLSDVAMQKSKDLIISSTIEDVNNSMTEMNNQLESFQDTISKRIAPFAGRLKTFSSESRKMSKKVTANSNLLKKLLPSSKLQSAKTRKISSALAESQEEIRKAKNLINRRLRTANRANEELEKKIKSQRKRIVQLNKKIELSSGKKASRRAARRTARKTAAKKPARKVITRKITPKKTVTIIKTPKRKITKTVTKNKTITKKETPKTKQVYEVIKEKNPLI